jgi:steroid delta-isomerase-like uncharacterized protein
MVLPPPAQAAHDLIARYYATFNGGDRSAFLALLTEDVVHDLNQGDREIGKPVFATFLARMDRCYREQIRDIRITVGADGTHAAAEYVVHGTYLQQDDGLPPATGQTYVLPGGAFFDLRGGKVARVTNYYNLQDWLAQIG